MLSNATYSLGEGYTLVIGPTERYATVALVATPGEAQTDVVRREARSRWSVAITLGPWKPGGVSVWRANLLTCLSCVPVKIKR